MIAETTAASTTRLLTGSTVLFLLAAVGATASYLLLRILGSSWMAALVPAAGRGEALGLHGVAIAAAHTVHIGRKFSAENLDESG